MELKDTVGELFDPTFEAIGGSDLDREQKRTLLYNLYCFACAIYPEYVATPHDALFEYGCCFLTEPSRHPDYSAEEPMFKRNALSAPVLAGGGRWYTRRGDDFIKYDFGSPLYDRFLTADVIPPIDRSPIPMLSLYAAVYCVCNLFERLRPLWYTYYFYLDATNEPVDEEFDQKLFELLHDKKVYEGAAMLRGSMLIGDEVELNGADKLIKWYKPFIDWRRENIFDVFEKKMEGGEIDFVCEYSTELLKCYPENASLMNWNAAARTERVIRDKDVSAFVELIRDLRDYVAACDSAAVKKYLKLAELMQKNVDAGA